MAENIEEEILFNKYYKIDGLETREYYTVCKIDDEKSFVGLISTKGEVILDFNYRTITDSIQTNPICFLVEEPCPPSQPHGMYKVFRLNKETGKVEEVNRITEAQYDYITVFDHGLAAVHKEHWGIIDTNGDIVTGGLYFSTIENFCGKNLSFINVKDIKYHENSILNLTELKGYQGPHALDVDRSKPLIVRNYYPIKAISASNFRKFFSLPNLQLGSVTYLIGANNAGKSTFLNLLALANANVFGIKKVQNRSYEGLFSINFPNYHGLQNNTYDKTISYGASGKLEMSITIGDVCFSFVIDNYHIDKVSIFNCKLNLDICYTPDEIAISYCGNNIVRNKSISEPEPGKYLFDYIWGIAKHSVDKYFNSKGNNLMVDLFEADLLDCIGSAQSVHLIIPDLLIDEHLSLIGQLSVWEAIQFLPFKKFIDKWIKEMEIGDGCVIEWHSLKVKDNYYNQYIDILEKGRGSIRFCSLLLQIVDYLVNNNNDGDRSILLIEEPEQNLHPKLQSKLADFFNDVVIIHKEVTGYDIQLIIETHSEYIVRKTQVLANLESCKYENEEELNEKFSNKILYFPERNKAPYSMIYRMNGLFRNTFGPGFFDESDKLVFDII